MDSLENKLSMLTVLYTYSQTTYNKFLYCTVLNNVVTAETNFDFWVTSWFVFINGAVWQHCEKHCKIPKYLHLWYKMEKKLHTAERKLATDKFMI